MIVYGDPRFVTTSGTLCTGLRTRLEILRHLASPGIDELRTLLILFGQLEQAADDILGSEASWELHTATDIIADAFVALLLNKAPNPSYVERLLVILDRLELDDTTSLTVKIPEGFAFYTLYPEQFHTATLGWITEHEHVAPVVVAGIRSIGTSLAAVVAQSLAAYGWPVQRLSLRPSGHPFEREANIDPGLVAGAHWGLVVDEGPGMSGSSMAAVGVALVHAGIERSRITFLPSHEGEPSSAASDDVRAWWQNTARLVTPLADLRLDGHTLTDALAAATRELCDEPIVAVDDCGGGLWRRFVYSTAEKWPAVYAPFERTKYRCTTASGRHVLWKFGGLAGGPLASGIWQSIAEAETATLAARAARGQTLRPLAVRYGFMALDWLDGRPLRVTDTTPALLEHIGRSIALFAGPPLTVQEQIDGIARLAELLYWNTWELLGEEVAGYTRPWTEAANAAVDGALTCYGDGRQAPHEWLRSLDGAIHKTDTAGHALDHTIIGRQPIVWDLAGALVEWEMDGPAATSLFTGYRAAGGPAYPPDLLGFCRLAYLAFRAGQAELCAGMSWHDPDEQHRLWAAKARYTTALGQGLALEPTISR